MSENALSEARAVDRDHAHRNDARRILERVESALEGHHSTQVRWPFELVQNAHDFGARDGDDLVEIEFAYENGNLVVSHNGRIFSIPELKALLSGGSSKEFDGDDTSGRFGTGFLVTRVHIVQLCYNVSDPGMEDLLYEAESVTLRGIARRRGRDPPDGGRSARPRTGPDSGTRR